MYKHEFLNLLQKASFEAYAFAKKYVKDKLPEKFTYDVYLNFSNDNLGLRQFDIYPEDNDVVLKSLSENEVVEVLCRNGKIPV